MGQACPVSGACRGGLGGPKRLCLSHVSCLCLPKAVVLVSGRFRGPESTGETGLQRKLQASDTS